MVMTHTRAKGHGQRSLGSTVTDGLTRLVTRYREGKRYAAAGDSSMVAIDGAATYRMLLKRPATASFGRIPVVQFVTIRRAQILRTGLAE